MALEELPEVFADEEHALDAAFVDHCLEEIAGRIDQSTCLYHFLLQLARCHVLRMVNHLACTAASRALGNEVALVLIIGARARYEVHRLEKHAIYLVLADKVGDAL